jgi:hypothetical protein
MALVGLNFWITDNLCVLGWSCIIFFTQSVSSIMRGMADESPVSEEISPHTNVAEAHSAHGGRES